METLRGYPEEWFNVEKALTLSLEVRRLLGAYSRIYAFIDAATLGGAASSFGNLENLPYGYGFGFMGGTTAGILRLEIAMGRGDTWSEAKLHLGFVEQF
jgi:hemolysin activation/secretion protein